MLGRRSPPRLPIEAWVTAFRGPRRDVKVLVDLARGICTLELRSLTVFQAIRAYPGDQLAQSRRTLAPIIDGGPLRRVPAMEFPATPAGEYPTPRCLAGGPGLACLSL